MTRVTAPTALGRLAVAAGEGFRLESGPGIRITTSTLHPEESERLADNLARILSPAAVSSVA